jgi:hypothetical protein
MKLKPGDIVELINAEPYADRHNGDIGLVIKVNSRSMPIVKVLFNPLDQPYYMYAQRFKKIGKADGTP